MPEYSDRLWRAVADLSGLLLAEETPETTLKRIADLAVRCIDGCAAVGVTLAPGSQPVTLAATGGLVYEVDHYQYDIGEGPSLTSLTERDLIVVEEMASEARWPRFCRHAADRGVHSSLCFPLLVRNQPLGTLNLYAYSPHAFTARDRETGAIFAAQAAVSLANAQTYLASITLAAKLREALDSRAVIDQAMGILIGQHGYSQELAFDELRLASQTRNRKLRDVALEIVTGAQQGPMIADRHLNSDGRRTPSAGTAAERPGARSTQPR